jgi:hypothetical protein
VALSIGTTQAAIVAAVFMELQQRGLRTFIFAAAGVLARDIALRTRT